jgi:hypothetical protein
MIILKNGVEVHEVPIEQLNQDTVILHPEAHIQLETYKLGLYGEVRTVRPVAVAADHFFPVPSGGVPRPDGPELGRSVAKLFVHPSPATAAERLGDMFLTAQFGLALLIASVVYFWRYAGPPGLRNARLRHSSGATP